jgi:hypothetical protein
MPLESCNPRQPKTESSAKELEETKKKTITQKRWDCNRIYWTMIKLLLQNTHTHTKDTGEAGYKASSPKSSLCFKESTPHAPFSWSATPTSSQLSSLSLVSLLSLLCLLLMKLVSRKVYYWLTSEPGREPVHCTKREKKLHRFFWKP